MSEPVYRPSQLRVLLVGGFLLAIIAAIIAGVLGILLYIVWPLVSQNSRDERVKGVPVEVPRPGGENVGMPLFRKDLPIPPAIFAPPGDQRIDVKLPATANRVAMGGSGRWCVIHFPRIKTVSIFDVSLAKFVRTIPAPHLDVSIAANATHVILYRPDEKVFERWNIETGVKEEVIEKDYGSDVDQMAMGSASSGPLVILRKKRGVGAIEIVDPLTFAPVALGNEGSRFTRVDTPTFIAVSSDGLTITKTEFRTRPSFEVSQLRFSKDHAPERISRSMPTRYMLPSFDGEHLYGNGIYDAELNSLPSEPFRMPLADLILLPSEHDRYYLGVTPGLFDNATIAIHDQDSKQILITLSSIGVGSIQQPIEQTKLHAPHRIHLIPRANRLLVVVPEKDQLSLYPLALEKLREQKKLDPFDFRVIQVPLAVPGELWRPVFAGDVTIEILRGPEKMVANDESGIEWQVPPDQRPGPVEVLLRVENEDGAERLIGIRLMVKGAVLPP